MKEFGLIALLFLFFSCVTSGQPALIASEDDEEATNVIFNPEWVKAHAVKEIIFDRFYANQPKGQRYNATSLVFDSTGYQSAEFEAKDTDHPDEHNFDRKKVIQYFIYGHALIKSVKTFGRKDDVDTLENFPDAYILAGNPESLNELIVGPDTIFYAFDELRRPKTITQADGVNVRTIEYNKKGQISKIMQNYNRNSRMKQGSYREYVYADDDQISSIKIYRGSHMFMRVRYEYDEKDFAVKSFIYLGQDHNMTLVYKYMFEPAK